MTKDDRMIERERLIKKVQLECLAALKYRMQRGWTLKSIARRAGMKRRELLALILSDNFTMRDIGTICHATDMDSQFETIDTSDKQ